MTGIEGALLRRIDTLEDKVYILYQVLDALIDSLEDRQVIPTEEKLATDITDLKDKLGEVLWEGDAHKG